MHNLPYKSLSVAFALMLAAVSAQATNSQPNTYDTIYGVNFGNKSSYKTTFLGNVEAKFEAKVGSADGKFSLKQGQGGYQGIGVSPRNGGERTPGEIDIGESITGSFSKGVKLRSFSVGLLFDGPEYKDVNEKAVISVTYVDQTTATFSLVATGTTAALWDGRGKVTNLSPALDGKGGAWLLSKEPFGGKRITSISFGAATGQKAASCGWCTNQSDYTFMSITAAVPEPETYAMLLAGLAAIGAIARRKKKV